MKKARLAYNEPDGPVVCAVCSGPADDAHHPIRRAYLKLNYLTFRKSEEEKARILYDPRNRVWLCRDCHDKVTNRSKPLYFDQLPGHVIAFANEHKLVHILQREHPERD